MPNHWSLVIFTLMVQSAVGSIWCLQTACFWNGGRVDSAHLKFQIIVALGLVLAGLGAAIAHLGRPGGSLQAVRNLKSSWLSREIFSVSLFAVLLALMAVLAQIRPGASKGWLLLVGSLAGGAVLYAMTRVYRLRTVPCWNHAGTSLTFAGSALLLGGLMCTLVLKLLTLLQVIGHAAMGRGDFRMVALMVVLAGFILKLLACRVRPCGTISSKLFKTRQPVLQGVGVVLWMITVFAAGNPVSQSLLLFSAAACLVYGEVIHRARFYSAYQRVGL